MNCVIAKDYFVVSVNVTWFGLLSDLFLVSWSLVFTCRNGVTLLSYFFRSV